MVKRMINSDFVGSAQVHLCSNMSVGSEKFAKQCRNLNKQKMI